VADRGEGRNLGSEAEERGRSTRQGGASPLSDDDRRALEGGKSEWQERTAPAANDPLGEDELNGLNLVGGSSIRDGALGGVSDPIRDGSGAPRERAGDDIAGGRKNPPLMDDAGTGDGGISAAGGAAGGGRGHGGSSDAGAGSPDSGSRGAEHRDSSRVDLDHPGR
jgi:hypothetical protein